MTETPRTDPADREAPAASHAPVATVVIPSYESGTDVRTAVASALAQTLTDIEVLVVDDGSQHDPVPEDLPADPRLVIDRRPVNGGYSRVTNHALRRARGRWVHFLDSDDEIAPDVLEKLVRAGEEADAAVVLMPLIAIQDGVANHTLAWNPPGPVSTGREAMRAMLRNNVVGSQHVLLRDPQPVAPEGLTYGDWITLMRHVARAERVAYADDAPYLYTIQEISQSAGLRPSVWGLLDLPELAAPLIRETFEPDEAAALEVELRRHTVTHVLHKAAGSSQDSPLRREVTAWARARITPRGALALAREGHRAEAAEWLLMWISPVLHRRAYQAYGARKRRHRNTAAAAAAAA
ncbi:glycosyltransferase family 2 protein [Brachybacterium sp. AOP25-B2-12]|uniref:glycosyltransferase family 2 protein n=1 Tax=Brachybacterium sp. AOP25-B2-12 TaxID=3457710 RepID=UPI0040344ED5